MAFRALIVALFAFGIAAPSMAEEVDVDFFERKIRPVLHAQCFECHSGTAKELQAGLRLDARPYLLEGGDTGPAVVAGVPEKSLLIESLHYGPDSYQMPPKAKLPDETIRDFERWITAGMPWPDDAPIAAPAASRFQITDEHRSYWAFRPLAAPALPPVKQAAWPKQSLDRFILAKLEAAGIEPAAPADNVALLRRLTYDLTGLPPTAAEISDWELGVGKEERGESDELPTASPFPDPRSSIP